MLYPIQHVRYHIKTQRRGEYMYMLNLPSGLMFNMASRLRAASSNDYLFLYNRTVSNCYSFILDVFMELTAFSNWSFHIFINLSQFRRFRYHEREHKKCTVTFGVHILDSIVGDNLYGNWFFWKVWIFECLNCVEWMRHAVIKFER